MRSKGRARCSTLRCATARVAGEACDVSHARAMSNFAHVLPLGSYTWEVEVCKSHSKKRKYESISPVFRYKITVLHGKMRDDEIFVLLTRCQL